MITPSKEKRIATTTTRLSRGRMLRHQRRQIQKSFLLEKNANQINWKFKVQKHESSVAMIKHVNIAETGSGVAGGSVAE